MATVQIDDKVYFDALQYIWGQEPSPGVGEGFEGWIRASESGIESTRWSDLSATFAGLIGHYSGEYDFDSPWDNDKTLVWSFYRAWMDSNSLPH
jgi:hypothetical protein